MNKSVSFENRTFQYSSVGKGNSVIILLHGFLGCKEIWNEYASQLSEEYKVIAIDLPGHGQSDVMNEVTTMSQMAALVHVICSIEKVNHSHIIGHSMGGYVALAFDRLYPNFLNSITLMNSTANEDTEQKKKDRILAARVFDLNPSVFILEAVRNLFYTPNITLHKTEVDKLIEMAKQTSAKGAQASLLGMRERFESVNHLRKTQKPVHFIAGKQDNTILYSTIEDQIVGMNATLTSFDSCGHMAFIEQKEATFYQLIKFIKAIDNQ